MEFLEGCEGFGTLEVNQREDVFENASQASSEAGGLGIL
jgi:hypothetical protein